MYKAIIFDFFDVIRTDAVRTWLNKHGYVLEGPLLEVSQKMDRGEIEVDEFLNLLSKITGQASDSIFEEMEEGAKIDYNVLALVSQLHKQYKIGLLSNASSSFLRNLLQEHDLEKYFDEIVISSEVGLIKPEAAIFQHILSKMKAEPAETIFIDDNPKNVAGAQAVGLQAIVYTDLASLRTALDALGVHV
jgi:putative hydrolase of the HAD superfamily